MSDISFRILFQMYSAKTVYCQIVVLALIIRRGSARSYICFTSQWSTYVDYTEYGVA